MKGMRLYCFASMGEASRLLAGEFDDASGVWLTDNPLGLAASGRAADVVLTVDGLEENEILDYEVGESGGSYREWLVPALFLERGVLSVDIDEQI